MMARCARDYALVSGVCLFINNVILIIMDRARLPLPASVAVSFAVCVVVGYVLHGRISFRGSLGFAAFARYVAAMSVNVPLALATLWLWRDLAALRVELAVPLATASTTVVNFALCRFAVFGSRDAQMPLEYP